MKKLRPCRPLKAALLMLGFLPFCAQAEEAHIAYFFPAGVQAGKSIDVTIGGQYLKKATGVHITPAEGLRAEILGCFVEYTSQEINRLRNRREKIDQTIDKAEGEEKARLAKELAEILSTYKEQGFDRTGKKRIVKVDRRRQLNPQLREQLSLRFTVAADAAPGPREIRVRSEAGLSNPMNFFISKRREVRETEPNDGEPGSEAAPLRRGEIYNGQILPGDVDCIRLPLAKGEELQLAVQARALVPYLADAVPGWFQAVIEVYNPRGVQVAYVDDYLFNPDPVLMYQAAEAGDHILKIRDSIYRGREDFVYRITRSAASKQALTSLRPRPSDLQEQDPNEQARQAQALGWGKTAFGRIGKPGDRDRYQIKGRAGQKLVAEVQARRLGSPLDAVLQLCDAKGKSLALEDDSVDRGAGLTTHHADCSLSCTLPADGTYTLSVQDLQQQGDANHAYRLELREARPDFDLRVTPASINVAAGASVPLTVHILRRDGFDGAVHLSVMELPEGFHLHGGRIPPGTDRVRCTLTVPRAAPAGTRPLIVEGRATLGDRELKHRAAPAEDMMQAFLYRHLVQTRRGLLTVTGRAKMAVAIQEPHSPDGALQLSPGGTALVVLKNSLGRKVWGKPHFALSNPPPGIRLGKINIQREQNRIELTLEVDAQASKAGSCGNLIIDVLASSRNKKVLCRAPAIPFEILAATPSTPPPSS